MPLGAVRTYAGTPLPPALISFLEFLAARGFSAETSGPSGKTIRILKGGQNLGYVNGTVVQRGALLGYHFGAIGHRSDSAPAELADRLSEWACNRFNCSESEIDVHSGAGSNAGRVFLLLKSPAAALQALHSDSGDEAHADSVVVVRDQRYVEGRVIDVASQKKERDPRARAACLAEYGFDCFVCGTNLCRQYEQLQYELVHVHHENPLADAEGEREFDPVATMKPLCPNCHCVAHSRTPPYSIAELRGMLRAKS